MGYEFKFPDVGEGIQEGVLVSWKVKEGDTVKVDQVLAEVETDKAVVEVPAPVAGTIISLFAKAGETIKVGQVILVIGQKGEKAQKPMKQDTKISPKIDEHGSGKSVVGVLEEAEEPVKAVKKEAKKGNEKQIVMASPKARKAAKDSGVSLSLVTGSGPEGEVVASDVAKGSKVTSVSSEIKHVRKYDFYGMVKRIPYSGIRKIIGDHMVEAVTKVPHVTHHDEADVTALAKLREKEKKGAEKKGVKLTFLPFVLKALEESLREHPMLNSSLDEEEGNIIVKDYYNIGIAVDTEAGLLVPVVKQTNQKGILTLAKEIDELAAKAKARKLDAMDMKGGTFTITNYGSVGGKFATPIVNYPECAILGLGRIEEKVMVVNGKVVVRKVLPFSISFDHRITDGAEVARFANTFKSHLEDPGLLLMDFL